MVLKYIVAKQIKCKNCITSESFFVLYSQKSNHFGTINAFKITNVILDNTKIEFCMYFSQYIKINVF